MDAWIEMIHPRKKKLYYTLFVLFNLSMAMYVHIHVRPRRRVYVYYI